MGNPENSPPARPPKVPDEARWDPKDPGFEWVLGGVDDDGRRHGNYRSWTRDGVLHGESNYVRVQVLTNAGALDRDKQLAVVRQLTDIVAAAGGDPALVDRTWVMLTEAVPGGWGLKGHANTNEELVVAARAEIAAGILP